MNKLITDENYTRSAADVANSLFENLSDCFILLMEVKEILDNMSDAEIRFLNGDLPHLASGKMNTVDITIRSADQIFAIDDKSYGWTDLLRNYRFIIMDITRMRDDLLLKYSLK